MIAKKHVTLSRRLLVALGIVSLLYLLVMATLTTRENISEVHELYDVHLAHTAKAFLHLMDPDDDEKESIPATLSPTEIDQLFASWPDLPMRPTVSKKPSVSSGIQSAPTTQAAQTPVDAKKVPYGHSLRYQLWRDDGSLMFRSDNAPRSVMTETNGFSDAVDPQQQGWRHYRVHDQQHHVSVIVSEPHEFRQQLVASMLVSAVIPLVLGLVVLFILLWYSVKKGLHPLATLSHEISKRQPDNLTLIDEQSVPGEVQPIVSALNDLLTRMGQTLENERRFTDDAAHQLRTPLAAIQVQLYAARHSQAGPPHQLALDQMQQSVSRGIRLVNQLLALARLDPKQAMPDVSPVHLGEIAQTVCAEQAPLALQRDQTLELLVAPNLPFITGNADMLSMLISNLLDNAIHYTQPGGHITVNLEPDGNGVQLEITDDGPGIAPDQRGRVFERFYRIASQSQPGTGLGLAICMRVAELHHTSLMLSEGMQGHGLSVRVYFAA